MAVFHWCHLVGNYGFFEQCLLSRLGLVVLSHDVTVDRKITNMFDISLTLSLDLSSIHLIIILSWVSMACEIHFPSCPIL